MDSDRERRLAFAVPPIADPDDETRYLEPADPDERSLLIRAAHPELDTDARPSCSTAARRTRDCI